MCRCMGLIGGCLHSYSGGTPLSSGVEVERVTINTLSIGRTRLSADRALQPVQCNSDVKIGRPSDKHRELQLAPTHSCLCSPLLLPQAREARSFAASPRHSPGTRRVNTTSSTMHAGLRKVSVLLRDDVIDEK
jgi:hypothetical protein